MTHTYENVSVPFVLFHDITWDKYQNFLIFRSRYFMKWEDISSSLTWHNMIWGCYHCEITWIQKSVPKIVACYFTLVHNGNQASLEWSTPPKHNISHNTYNLWWSYWYVYHINPFHATVLFLYPLKKTDGLWFSDVLEGIERGHWMG